MQNTPIMQIFSKPFLNKLSTLIAQRTGLNTFDHGRGRLIEILQRHAGASHQPEAYLVHLQMLGDNHPVWQALLAELTVGETYFMRDQQQVDALRHHILPSLIEEKRRKNTLSLRIWSAGCATGEEAYSLAILVHELIPDRHHWHIQIMGTDINDTALEVAEVAQYRDWSFRNTLPELRERYFTRQEHGIHGKITLIFEVQPYLRETVSFRHHNLIQNGHAFGQQDLVICRNVLLYFTKQNIEIAEDHLAKSLQDNGWLLLSSAEAIRHTRHCYQVEQFSGSFAYHKSTKKSQAKNTPPSPEDNTESSDITLPNLTSASVNLDSNSTYRRAIRARQRSDWETAYKFAQQTLDTDIPQQVAHVLIASILMGLGDSETAFTHLQHALNYNTLLPDAHYLLSLIHIKDDDPITARNALRAAIYCRPDFALAHLLSGDLFLAEGDRERASRAWMTARRFAAELPPEVLLSDVADMNAEQLLSEINSRLGNSE
jgi:chemotaxis protein methyltransferase CheR